MKKFKTERNISYFQTGTEVGWRSQELQPRKIDTPISVKADREQTTDSCKSCKRQVTEISKKLPRLVGRVRSYHRATKKDTPLYIYIYDPYSVIIRGGGVLPHKRLLPPPPLFPQPEHLVPMPWGSGLHVLKLRLYVWISNLWVLNIASLYDWCINMASKGHQYDW